LPNLSLEIEVDITPNLRARLMAQEIDLAFVSAWPASNVRNRVLAITRSHSLPAHL
jgi:DNA-binding transcriptional LysR family regulator